MSEKFDVVVIGSGIGGGATGGVLASYGAHVLVLEAGPDVEPINYAQSALPSQIRPILYGGNNPWQFEAGGELGSGLKTGGGTKVTGGNSVVYTAMQVTPCDECLKEWPIPKEVLEVHFDRVNKRASTRSWTPYLCGNGGIMHAGANALGLRAHIFNSPNATLQYNAIDDDPTSPAYGFPKGCTQCGFCGAGCKVHEAKRSSKVTWLRDVVQYGGEVRGNAQTAYIRTNVNGEASGVAYYDLDGVLHEVEADVVVLAAGPFEGTRVWLNSGLPNRYDVVGRYFCQTHVQTGSSVAKFPWDVNPHIGIAGAGVYFWDCDDKGDRGGFALEQSTKHPNTVLGWIQTFKAKYGLNLKNEMKEWKKWTNIGGGAWMDQKWENRLSLSSTYTDRFGLPIVKLETYYSDQEKARARRAAETARNLLLAAGAVELYPATTPAWTVPAGGCMVFGGLRMGNDPASSVIDPICEAWEVKRLFVGSGAALPNGIHGHCPNLSIGAVGSYIADQVKAKYFS